MMETEARKVTGVLSQHIYGPVDSRRYGVSLGINILPNSLKVCSFNCGYCECGYTRRLLTRRDADPALFPAAGDLLAALRERMQAMQQAGQQLDAVTFAGNGEPTLHPEFPAIARGTRELCNTYFPQARLVLLSNATTLNDEDIVAVLPCFDDAVMKLDTGRQETFTALNGPALDVQLDDICTALHDHPNVTVQALFLQGRVNNAAPEELEAWLQRLHTIRPRQVQLYTLERRPPDPELEPVDRATLDAIAARVRHELGVPAEVYV